MNPMEMHASRKVWEHRLRRSRAELDELHKAETHLKKRKAAALENILNCRNALYLLGGEQIQVCCEDEGCPHYGRISHVHASGAISEAEVEQAKGVHPFRDDQWQ